MTDPLYISVSVCLHINGLIHSIFVNAYIIKCAMAIWSTLIICVSSITFFSTSIKLPDPNSPVCPGLSTRISDATQRDVPLIWRSKRFLSRSQTLKTAGMAYTDCRVENSLRVIHFICKESNSRRTLPHSRPEAKIPAVIRRWKTGNWLCSGPVDQWKLWLLSFKQFTDIWLNVPIVLSRLTMHSELHLKQCLKHLTNDSSNTINFCWSCGDLLHHSITFWGFSSSSSSLSTTLSDSSSKLSPFWSKSFLCSS